MKGVKHRNPFQTKTGKVRVTAYSVAQLEEMVEKTSVPKIKQKMKNEIARKQQSI